MELQNRETTETTEIRETTESLKTFEKPEECFFCYNIFTERKPRVTENHIGCTCRFPIHQTCWERWNILECPICHSCIEEEEEELQETQVPYDHRH